MGSREQPQVTPYKSGDILKLSQKHTKTPREIWLLVTEVEYRGDELIRVGTHWFNSLEQAQIAKAFGPIDTVSWWNGKHGGMHLERYSEET